MMFPEYELAAWLKQMVELLCHSFGVGHRTEHLDTQNCIYSSWLETMSLKNIAVFNTAGNELIYMLEPLFFNLPLAVRDKMRVTLNAYNARDLALVIAAELIAQARTQLEHNALALGH